MNPTPENSRRARNGPDRSGRPPDGPVLAADFSFATEDVDVIEEQSDADGWGIGYTQLEPGQFRGHYAAWAVSDYALTHETYGRRLNIRGEGPSSLIVPAQDSGPLHFNGKAIPRTGFALLRQGDEVDVTTLGAIDFSSFHFNQSSFDRADQVLFGGEAAEKLTRPHDPSHPAFVYADLRKLLPVVRSNGRALAGWYDGEESKHQLLSRLMENVVSVIAGSPDPGTSRKTISSRHCTLEARRARDFLEANLHRNVSRTELCAVSGAKLRTLLNGFERCFGISPIAYHRYRRLKEAHDLLRRCDPSVLSVTEAATGSGFFHLGRFSADYKRVFGESPSTTLARTAPLRYAKPQTRPTRAA